MDPAGLPYFYVRIDGLDRGGRENRIYYLRSDTDVAAASWVELICKAQVRMNPSKAAKASAEKVYETMVTPCLWTAPPTHLTVRTSGTGEVCGVS